MKKFSLLSSVPQMLYKSSFLAVLTVTSLVCTTLVFNFKVAAQNQPNPTDIELKNYANILLEMEPMRQEAFDKIKKLMPERTVPKIVCNDKNSINNLPNQAARNIAVNFCQRYQKIVKKNNMNIDRFNEMTDIVKDNNELKNDMYELLLDIQNNSSQ